MRAAPRERREQLRAMRAMAAAGGPLLAPPQRQTVGDFVGLCLLIDFSDSPATIAREEVERFCNQPGYTGFGNNGSVLDFFLENSIGRCRYTNIVAPYYRALASQDLLHGPHHPAAAARLRADQRSAGLPQGARLRLLAADGRQPGVRLRDERLLRGTGHEQLGRGAVAASHHLGSAGAAAAGHVGVRLPVHRHGIRAGARHLLP